MAKFQMSETIYSEKNHTTRLGATGAGNQYGYEENGKAMKLSGDSTHVLASVGNEIEAIQTSSNYPEQGTVDGYSIGGVAKTGYKAVVLDGLQATPGTGVVAVGDYVVTGTVVAKGTALTTNLKVCKATDQAAAKAFLHPARVVSLGAAGTGAVGTAAVIELI